MTRLKLLVYVRLIQDIRRLLEESLQTLGIFRSRLISVHLKRVDAFEKFFFCLIFLSKYLEVLETFLGHLFLEGDVPKSLSSGSKIFREQVFL